MGKIEIKGCASRKVQCDVMEIKITFIAEARSSEMASRQVMEQCELFLEKLEGIGVDITKIKIEDDSVRKSIYREECKFNAERGICLKAEFDMTFVNVIRELLNSIKAESNIGTNFILSNSEEISAQLLKEALLDSKKKASDIAEALGQKLIGLISANKKGRFDYSDDEENERFEYPTMPSGDIKVLQFLKTNALQSPERTITEEIIAVWEIQ